MKDKGSALLWVTILRQRVYLWKMREDRFRQTRPESKPEPPGVRQRLQALRATLLNLHKTLVQSEGREYAKVLGKIQSPNHFLQLLMNDPWFAWLSPLSQLIVSIDEVLDGEAPLTGAKVDAFVKQSAGMLVASETGEGFSHHYYEALQRDPDVVLAHADVAKLRRARKPPE